MLADGQLGVVASKHRENEEMVAQMGIVLITDAPTAEVLTVVVNLYKEVACLEVGLNERTEGAVAVRLIILCHSVWLGTAQGAGRQFHFLPMGLEDHSPVFPPDS